MKKIVFLILFLLAIQIYAQITIGVTKFYNYSQVNSIETLSQEIQNEILSQLNTLSDISLIDKTQILSEMQNDQLTLNSLSSDINIKKLGDKIGATIIVTGNFEYNKLTKFLRINARIVDINSGLIIDSETVVDMKVFARDLKYNIATKIKNFIKQHYGLSETKTNISSITNSNPTTIITQEQNANASNIKELINLFFGVKSRQNQSIAIHNKNIVFNFYTK